MSRQTALERRVANLEKMIQISRALRSAFDLQSLLSQILHAIVELSDCEKSSILLVDPKIGELRFVALSGTDFEQVKDIIVPRQGSIAGTVVETREPIVIHDTKADPRFFSRVDQTTGQTTDSLLGVPLEIGGRVIGVLEAMNKKPGARFDQEDVETLLMFASQAAAAIENTRLIEEQRQRLTEVLLLQDVLLTLSRFIQVDRLLEQLLVLLEEWLGYTNCAVSLFDKERDTLHIETYRGFKGVDISNRIIAAGEGTVSGQVAMRRRPLNISDIAKQDLVAFLPDTRSALTVPMVCGEDVDLVGVIGLESPQAKAFSERDVRILSTIATQAAIGIRQAQLYEDSRRANRLKQEFITTMSHELRTPMTVIIGYCDMLAKESLGPFNEAQLSALKVIRDRSELLLRLLNDVLDFSKIASGELKLRPVIVNLLRVSEAVVEKYRVYAERGKQTVTIDIPSDCQYLLCDDQRLHQILGHLVHNAIKFSPEGRSVVIRAQPYDGDFVRIDVIDHGIGIKPEDTDLVFEDFRQLDNSFTRDYGGAGMGLSISKHLVELQGGLIWVESEFGKGSTFSFILPRPDPSGAQTVHIPIPDIPSREG